MQTKLIVLKPKPSIFISVVLIFGCIIIWHYNTTMFSLITLVGVGIGLWWYIFSHKYQLDLLTNENKLILWLKYQPHLAKVVKYQHIGFICTLLTLNYKENKTISMFIFIDSLSLTKYKQLQNFLIWS